MDDRNLRRLHHEHRRQVGELEGQEVPGLGGAPKEGDDRGIARRRRTRLGRRCCGLGDSKDVGRKVKGFKAVPLTRQVEQECATHEETIAKDFSVRLLRQGGFGGRRCEEEEEERRVDSREFRRLLHVQESVGRWRGGSERGGGERGEGSVEASEPSTSEGG